MTEAESLSSLSPMLRDYRQTQAQHPGAVVLWRNGEFFEVYFETARLLGVELNLRVKPRPFGKEVVDFTGVPLANVRDVAHRLLQRGYRVVIVEQSDAPTASERSSKKTITRSVARVLTPGTLVELDLLDGRANNYLAAVIGEHDHYGLAYCDVSTGEFAATEVGGKRVLPRLEGELMRLLPAEVLVSDDDVHRPPILPASRSSAQSGEGVERDMAWTRGHVTIWPAWRWDLHTATEALVRQFHVASLASFGLVDLPLAIRAAGAVLQYLQETHRALVAQIDHIRAYRLDTTMLLDPQTQRNLELLAPLGARKRGALIDLLDQTQTPMGARLLRRWVAQPLTELAPLQRRQDAVAGYVEEMLLRAEIRDALKGIGDIERVTNRVIQGITGSEDLRRLRESLRAVPRVATLVRPHVQAEAVEDEVEGWTAGRELDVCPEVLDLLERALSDDAERADDSAERGDLAEIRNGFDAEVDRVVVAIHETRAWMRAYAEHERERTGIKTLNVTSNSKVGWFIELPRATPAHRLPADYERKPGGSADERFTTASLQEAEARLDNGRLRLRELERAALARITTEVASHGRRLLATSRVLAEIDVFATLAEVAVRRRYSRPVLTEGTELQIVNGRHPLVEISSDDGFVPNDTEMNATDAQILVVTGPNMAGKSTYLRQVALIVLLAQVGSYVPADAARIGLVDRIFTRIGAQDDIVTGQSTFLVEMTETANILHSATGRSLIVLDELGRGTSTYDGMSIARSVIECIHSSPRLGCRTLFATHYHELTELADSLPRVRNAHITVAEHGEQIVFLRTVVPGKADRSYGIHVARMAGMPPSVVRRAQEVLTLLEVHSDEVRTRTNERPDVRMHTTQQAGGSQREATLPVTPIHPALRQLKALQIDELTPREALLTLYELQAMVADVSDDGAPGTS